MKEKTLVEYSAGQSRHTDKAVDYMLVEIDGVELYAEREISEDEYFEELEEARYNELVNDIAYQAEQNGIDVNRLSFWYD